MDKLTHLNGIAVEQVLKECHSFDDVKHKLEELYPGIQVLSLDDLMRPPTETDNGEQSFAT
jgi:hypothetical protein